jgi:hypothetical protein
MEFAWNLSAWPELIKPYASGACFQCTQEIEEAFRDQIQNLPAADRLPEKHAQKPQKTVRFDGI